MRKSLCLLAAILLLLACSRRNNNAPKIALPDTMSLLTLTNIAYTHMLDVQDTVNAQYKLSENNGWSYDPLSQELTFDIGKRKLLIHCEEAGTLERSNGYWTWAWADRYMHGSRKTAITRIRDFGERRQFSELTTPGWGGAQHDAWQMTAIAMYLLDGKGTFRLPSQHDSVFTFVIFKDLSWVR
ncbi:MAG: hypothetical protein U0T79_02915 [Ferruginibacter sp.]